MNIESWQPIGGGRASSGGKSSDQGDGCEGDETKDQSNNSVAQKHFVCVNSPRKREWQSRRRRNGWPGWIGKMCP